VTDRQTDRRTDRILIAIPRLHFKSYKYSDKWTKTGINTGICLGDSHDNFQLHRFTTNENIAQSFRGATFLTHTVESLLFFYSVIFIHKLDIIRRE